MWKGEIVKFTDRAGHRKTGPYAKSWFQCQPCSEVHLFFVIKCEKSEIRVNSCAKHGRCCIREDGDICVVKTGRDSMPDCWCCAGLNDDRV